MVLSFEQKKKKFFEKNYKHWDLDQNFDIVNFQIR